MNARDLIREFPWANKPGIVEFAGVFTRDQWKDMEDVGVSAFVNSNQVDPLYVTAFITSINMLRNQPRIAQLLRNGTLNFAGIVSVQLKGIQTMAQQAGMHQPANVISWLGVDLCGRMDREEISGNQIDNIAECLSSENTRKVLSGDVQAIAQAPFLPDSFAAIKGKDIRQLYRSCDITFSEFEKYITDFAIKHRNQFPRWIEEKNNLELNELASSFTQAQLIQIEQLMDERIRRETELSTSFLRVLLTSATHQSIKMKECSMIVFVELVKVQHQPFLEVFIGNAQTVESVDKVVQANVSQKESSATNEVLVSKQQEVISEAYVQSENSELRQRKVVDEIKEERKEEIKPLEKRSSSSGLIANSTFGGEKLSNKAIDEVNPNDTCCERIKSCVLL